MTQRTKLLLLVTLALLAGFSALWFARTREPVYEGKSLSQWHALYALSFDTPNPPPVTKQAADAIRKIGTNAIPFYLEWIKAETPRWRTKLDNMIDTLHLPKSFTKPLRAVVVGSDYGSYAVAGFGEAAYPVLFKALPTCPFPARISLVTVVGNMGTNALPAIPELVKALADSNRAVRMSATNALVNLAPDLLTNSPAQ